MSFNIFSSAAFHLYLKNSVSKCNKNTLIQTSVHINNCVVISSLNGNIVNQVVTKVANVHITEQSVSHFCLTAFQSESFHCQKIYGGHREINCKLVLPNVITNRCGLLDVSKLKVRLALAHIMPNLPNPHLERRCECLCRTLKRVLCFQVPRMAEYRQS